MRWGPYSETGHPPAILATGVHGVLGVGGSEMGVGMMTIALIFWTASFMGILLMCLLQWAGGQEYSEEALAAGLSALAALAIGSFFAIEAAHRYLFGS